MALNVTAQPTATPATLARGDETRAPKDATIVAPQPQAALPIDATVTSPPAEVEALRGQVVASETNAAANARSAISGSEGSGVQIGARLNLETKGITSVGEGGATRG